MPPLIDWNWEFVGYFLGAVAVITGGFAYTHSDRFLRSWLHMFVGFTGISTITGGVFWLFGAYPNVMLALFWAAVLAFIAFGVWYDRKEKRRKNKP